MASIMRQLSSKGVSLAAGNFLSSNRSHRVGSGNAGQVSFMLTSLKSDVNVKMKITRAPPVSQAIIYDNVIRFLANARSLCGPRPKTMGHLEKPRRLHF